jgi:hypothetical protein
VKTPINMFVLNIVYHVNPHLNGMVEVKLEVDSTRSIKRAKCELVVYCPRESVGRRIFYTGTSCTCVNPETRV